MLSRNWLFLIALGGCLAFLQVWSQSPKGECEEPRAQNEQGRGFECAENFLQRVRRTFDPIGRPSARPESEQATQENTPYKDAEDLKAQIAMADYGFGILVVTGAQLLIGLLTLAGLGWTIFETRRTANASVLAANAARESAEALPKLERAYIFENVRNRITTFTKPLQRVATDKGPITSTEMAVEFSLTNHGKTPAVVRFVGYGSSLDAVPSDPLYVLHHGMDTEVIIASGAQSDSYVIQAPFLIDKDQAQAILGGTSYLYYFALVVYDDVFGVEHETKFYWQLNGSMLMFAPLRWGDHNKRT